MLFVLFVLDGVVYALQFSAPTSPFEKIVLFTCQYFGACQAAVSTSFLVSFHEKVECAKLGEKMRAWRKLVITVFIFGFVTVFVYEYSK